MPAKRTQKQSVCCPHCGHRQSEPLTAYSTVCKSCRRHFRLGDLTANAGPRQSSPALRSISCFSCGTILEVPASAQSTMCKRCSSHVDLSDYNITSTVSKNFRTKGRFVIEATGYVLNTDTIATDVVLKGRLIGKIQAENSLEIHTSAEIKGSFQARHLIIPPHQKFWWPELITSPITEVAGELVANLQAAQGVILRSTARFFGNVHAPNLVIEEGAVFVGQARIGSALQSVAKPAGRPSRRGDGQRPKSKVDRPTTNGSRG